MSRDQEYHTPGALGNTASPPFTSAHSARTRTPTSSGASMLDGLGHLPEVGTFATTLPRRHHP